MHRLMVSRRTEMLFTTPVFSSFLSVFRRGYWQTPHKLFHLSLRVFSSQTDLKNTIYGQAGLIEKPILFSQVRVKMYSLSTKNNSTKVRHSIHEPWTTNSLIRNKYSYFSQVLPLHIVIKPKSSNFCRKWIIALAFNWKSGQVQGPPMMNALLRTTALV